MTTSIAGTLTAGTLTAGTLTAGTLTAGTLTAEALTAEARTLAQMLGAAPALSALTQVAGRTPARHRLCVGHSRARLRQVAAWR